MIRSRFPTAYKKSIKSSRTNWFAGDAYVPTLAFSSYAQIDSFTTSALTHHIVLRYAKTRTKKSVSCSNPLGISYGYFLHFVTLLLVHFAVSAVQLSHWSGVQEGVTWCK